VVAPVLQLKEVPPIPLAVSIRFSPTQWVLFPVMVACIPAEMVSVTAVLVVLKQLLTGSKDSTKYVYIP